MEAAQGVQSRTRRLLEVYRHAPNTKTPSPPGSYPAYVTGLLSASIDARLVGEEGWVGPTELASSNKGPYGRFLELGGMHVASSGPAYTDYATGASSGPQMWWHEEGKWHHAGILKKAPRPYLEPATDAYIASGELYDTYWRHWLVAQEAVTP